MVTSVSIHDINNYIERCTHLVNELKGSHVLYSYTKNLVHWNAYIYVNIICEHHIGPQG